MTFKDYLDCFPKDNEDMFDCLEMKYGLKRAESMVNLYNKRYVEDLSHKYKVYTDIDTMTFGQFSTVETLYNADADNTKLLLAIAGTVIRPIDEKVFDNTNITKEQEHLDNISAENAKDIIAILNKLSDNRNEYIHSKYNGVFYKSKQEVVQEEDDNTVDESLETTFTKQWYWYQIQDMLANNDITKHKDVEDMEMIRVAPHLAYLRMKNKLEYKQMRDAEFQRQAQMMKGR